MSEFEKMLAGKEYDPSDFEVRRKNNKGKNLIRKYNAVPAENIQEKSKILNELFEKCGKNVRINQPFYVDFGCNISIGDNSIINFNCSFLDTNKIIIGKNAVIAPDVKIYAAYHPVNGRERFCQKESGESFLITASSPVVIGDDVWIGGGSIILPGVTIGNNVVIGAGSVVTKSIPENIVAYGNPCRVIRENK